MTWKSRGPGGCPTAPAPNTKPDTDCTAARAEKSIVELGDVYAFRILEAERSLLCAGWRDTTGLVDAAVDAGLTGTHFVDPPHAFQFAYLCICAELDRWPSVGEALSIAGKCNDIFLDADELDDVLWRTDDLPSMLPTFAETVVENAREFIRAQQGLRDAMDILMGTIGFDFDIIVRPRIRLPRMESR